MATTAQFLIDTSILIGHIRQKPPNILTKAIRQYGVAAASDVSIFELEVGARRAGRAFEFATEFPGMLTYPLIPPIWIEAAIVQVDLLKRNQIIGVLDVFIAATALHHHLPLLTLNTPHFQRVTGLILLPLP